ncbi:3-hydroxyacyl-CoA dehydrogenase [Pueribacillus theae]|uniref:3-hydroxyacyl-CoA dehydrogenase n=1 Tax=Pueribacillus theae TaxID=2171751 RepID=A0A2U1K4B0_9BACI|nr:3-hydroxyacyl-CoA dehydrogenase/enoyl-CoA hydratase family protein [Pueribacillus theae]PWA12024.1 3-hydroxyacyl-CoA dehydrogenase [Pueribacillus theae]
MAREIQRAAVIGSGVMGSGIAAHLANIGIPTLLLDIVPNELTKAEKEKGLSLSNRVVRNRLADAAVAKLFKQKPAPLTKKKNASFITTGNLEDDLEKLAEVDWIIEVIVENLEIKKQLFEKVDVYRKEGTIVSSNTSGISIEAMAEGRSADFKAHFLGTHFFNPPRYLKLLEIIPTKETKPEVVAYMKQFGENVLGKGVVEAKDTPNFIANRIGTYGLLVTVGELLKSGYSVGEIDSVTGTLIGRAKSATFRTLDVVGLDTFIHVANNVYENVDGEEKDRFHVPHFMKEMLEKGWLGSKTGQGFYKKEGKQILELNPETMEYEQRKKLKAPSIELAKQAKKSERLKTIIYADDRAGQLLWNTLSLSLLYAAEKAYEIADDIYAVDQAMKWGFGWEQGPFETWDAIGVEQSVAKMEQEGKTVPSWVKDMLAAGNRSFYKKDNGSTFYYDNGSYKKAEENPKTINLVKLKEQNNVIKKNSGASLIDLGDGVLNLEFHSQNNAIGLDIIQMINTAIEEAEQGDYKGLVIGNQGKNFCVGANLALMLMEAQDDNFFELELTIRQFQDAMMRIRYSAKPVVAAPFSMSLGGGAEVAMPAAKIQASSETYMGLVEVGVGLIPGGGGNKELYRRLLEGLPEGTDLDLQKIANKTFETIAMAKVSTSADEAKEYGFLHDEDGISMNGDHLIYDAKQQVIHLADEGYRAPKRIKIPVVGETGYATMLMGVKSMQYSGYVSEYDVHIAKKLANVIAGGKLPYGTPVDEQYLLDLEREAFLSLIGERKTQERMQHMLVKGKPLRN